MSMPRFGARTPRLPGERPSRPPSGVPGRERDERASERLGMGNEHVYKLTSASDDYVLKLLIIGDVGVGKTSLLSRFADDRFRESVGEQRKRGADFRAKTLLVGGRRVMLTVWDTAGEEHFRTLTSSYYRGCHGIILCFDVNERETFTNLHRWLEEYELYTTTQHTAKLLVGNKIDLKAREVSVEEATSFARKQAMMYIEASAKTREGIRQSFEEVVQKILDTPALIEETGGGTIKGGMGGMSRADDEDNSRTCSYC